MKIDQIIRSARKTISIIVRQDGKLIVRAPNHATNGQILQFVESKARWIREKQTAAQERLAQAAPAQYKPGETFLYLGSAYPLEIVKTARPALTLVAGRFRLANSALPQARDVFARWYQQRAREVLEERSRLYASRYRLDFARIRISSARTRWGSCSSTGTLSYTWRLVMAPLPVIDYVVVHELAHLIEKNHSRKFWERVAAMMPGYTKQRDWLKENGHRLTLE